MGIKTPDVLPGEPGWEALQKQKRQTKTQEKHAKERRQKTSVTVGNIVLGGPAFRFGKSHDTHRGTKKFYIWRYKRKVAEVVVKNQGTGVEHVALKFMRFGSIANHKHLIQDATFQLTWMTREQELLMTQGTCYLCNKRLSRTAEPNLYHYNLFKKRTELLEAAEKVPSEVVSGKLTVEEGWNKYNDILESGNRYYMSLEETALLCPSCAKTKGLK